MWPSQRCVHLKSLHMVIFLLSSYHLKFLCDSSYTNEKSILLPSSLLVFLCLLTFLAYFIPVLSNFLISRYIQEKRSSQTFSLARFKAEVWKYALNVTKENTWKDKRSKRLTSLTIWEVHTKTLLQPNSASIGWLQGEMDNPTGVAGDLQQPERHLHTLTVDSNLVEDL